MKTPIRVALKEVQVWTTMSALHPTRTPVERLGASSLRHHEFEIVRATGPVRVTVRPVATSRFTMSSTAT
jgi:hypothetical protein